MRVAQLGCGITGLVCAEHLNENPAVEEIVLADFRTEAASALVSRLRAKKMTVAKVDAKNPKSVRKLLKGCDLLISSIPSELNLKVMEQTIAAGVNYLDYSVAHEVLDDFEKFSRKCRDAGIVAVTGMGADPGISDIFARYASNKLDSAHKARVMDGDNGAAEGYDFFTLWSPLDMLEEVTIPAAVFKNGRMTHVPPLEERQTYEFPDPIGPLPVYNTNHEETFMIPMFIKGIKDADFRIAVDDNFAKTANMLRKIGMHSLKPLDVRGTMVRPLDVVVAVTPNPVSLAGKVTGSAGVVVEVYGKKDGRDAMVKVWTTLDHQKAYRMYRSNATGYLVGTGGAVGAELVISGEIVEKGLYAPEMLPAETYIARLPSKGLEVKEEMVFL